MCVFWLLLHFYFILPCALVLLQANQADFLLLNIIAIISVGFREIIEMFMRGGYIGWLVGMLTGHFFFVFFSSSSSSSLFYFLFWKYSTIFCFVILLVEFPSIVRKWHKFNFGLLLFHWNPIDHLLWVKFLYVCNLGSFKYI